MTSEAVIVDGYVDEPACLGVPPYISPYIRTCAGLLKEHGIDSDYVTVDELRKNPLLVTQLRSYKYVVMIAGVTVPGKYLAGTPATISELQQIGFQLKDKTVSFLGGPISFGYSPEGGEKAVKNDVPGWSFMLRGEPAAALDSYFSGGEAEGVLSYTDFDRWAVLGAEIIKKHPMYPHVMLELETARGCSRSITGGCSFCTEPFYGMPRQREISGIAGEVKALFDAGAVHFRLGRQPDILSFGVSGGEFPTPDGNILRKLFGEICTAAPNLETLHIDNVNPGTIAHHPDAARDALSAIVEGHTPGDIAAFGVESADPVVISANNLKGSPDEIFSAVEIVNEIGAARRDGVPELLPGLNFISGLAGESPATFELNKAFLKKIFDAGLLVRRVNIRQLMPFEGTRAYENNTIGAHDKLFQSFKESVRSSFDVMMLQRVFPVGTVLKNVHIEVSGVVSFGRQMGTYPILVGIPQNLAVGTILDCAVVSFGARSVTALPVPIEINELPHTVLKWLPGVSKKVLPKIIAKRPFADAGALKKVIGSDAVNPLIPLMKF
ncbi:MAG TPA: radical SAM protein [Methanocorpusculum sp.]|nr:radical SAM protein [Methanocorpusculum sp.]